MAVCPLEAPTLNVSPSCPDLDSILESKRDKRKYSICAHKFVLKVALEFIRNISFDPSEQCKMAVTNTIRKDDPCGYFAVPDRNNANELHRSARLTHDLSVAYREIKAEGDVIFMHQSSLLRGSCDISVYMDIDTIEGRKFCHPSCCIEVGLSTSYTVEKKIAQVTAEANYLLKQMPTGIHGMWTPVLSVIMIIPGEIRISMCFLSRDREKQGEPKIAPIKIAQCPLSAESMFALLQALVMFNEMVKEVVTRPAQFGDSIMTPQPNSNVLVLDDTVYKVYDYRDSKQVTDFRSPNMYFTVNALHDPPLLDLLQFEVEDPPCLSIISYKKVSGGHQPSCVGDLLDILQTIGLMANAGLVHGDIRLANMIFLPVSASSSSSCSCSSSVAVSAGRRGVLIDFDFSGNCGQGTYPCGFNVNIEDGERHKGVCAGGYLQCEHDIYGFVSVCRLFELLPDSDASEWQKGTAPRAKKPKIAFDADRASQWGCWLENLTQNLKDDEAWSTRISNSLGSDDIQSLRPRKLRLRPDCGLSLLGSAPLGTGSPVKI